MVTFVTRRAGLAVLAAAATVLVGAVGCSKTEGASEASTDNTSSTRFDPSANSQNGAYAEALGRWKAFQRESADIMRRGKADERSASFYRKYFHDWRSQQDQLVQLEESGITFQGSQEVAWYKPEHVSEGAVTIAACVRREAIALKDGVELPPAGPSDPYLLLIEMTRVSQDGKFLIASAVPETEEVCAE